MITDPLSNMLTVIRNAVMRGYKTVTFPYSSFKWRICQKMEENNFFSRCWIDEEKKIIKVDVKYNNKFSRINELKVVSKPSQHIHLRADEIKKKLRGQNVYFISTSSGLMTNKEAVAKNIGGKVLFYVR